MSNGVDHAIGAPDACHRTVRTSALGLTPRRAFVHVANEGVLEVGAVDGGMGMEPAVGPAEPGSLIHVRRGENKINTIGITRQMTGSYLCTDNGGKCAITYLGTLGIVVIR